MENSESINTVQVTTKLLKEPLTFYVRAGSSDEKTLKEVVSKASYARRDFSLASHGWLDLGANIGAFTVLAAKLGAPVRAYEPDPASFAMLEMNVEVNGVGKLVELQNAAVVASKEKSVTFHVNSANKNYWRNRTVKAWRGGYSIEVAAEHFEKVIRADDDVKMDVEGSEMPVLEAMKKFPQRIVFEWSFEIDRSIPRFAAVVEKLRARYAAVTYPKFNEAEPAWRSEWFPPCRTVWCR